MLFESLATLAALELPQAGGGGGFGGGGGGGGGGGSGDGGLIIYLLMRLVIEAPLIGIPLLIFVIIMFAKSGQEGKRRFQDRVIRKNRPKRDAGTSRRAAAKLKREDPDFSEQRFLIRARKAFRKAQDSWCAQDLELLRPFVSDGVFERFSLQIEEQKLDGWRQGMEHLRVDAPTIAHIESGEHFDTITVSIPFSSDIHRLSQKTGKKISGSSLPRDSFREYWSFVRRRGAKTKNADGLIEGMCPNCGADLAMNKSARCGTCECVARSGQFDWVLSEITQSSVWTPNHEFRIPGLRDYMESDPGINSQLLEDRTSVAFWRMAAADRKGDSGPLECISTDELCESLRSKYAVPDGTRKYRADSAVGSVRTLDLRSGDDFDHATVEVVWDGVRATTQVDGTRELDKTRLRRTSLFILRRRSGQTTRLEDVFTTAHCQSCGAHDPGGTEALCAYCDAPRRGNKSTWLVHQILGRRTPEAREWLRAGKREAQPEAPTQISVSSPASADALLAWSAALIQADGEVSPAERRAVDSLAKRVGVPEYRVRELLDGPAQEELELDVRDSKSGPAWLGALFELALADGRLERDELRFLKHAATTLGVTPKEFKAIQKRTRTHLYQESR